MADDLPELPTVEGWELLDEVAEVLRIQSRGVSILQSDGARGAQFVPVFHTLIEDLKAPVVLVEVVAVVVVAVVVVVVVVVAVAIVAGGVVSIWYYVVLCSGLYAPSVMYSG